ncbi:MAG: Isoleucine--tRNA ligase [candidate division TA06 bacterium ADurb.Bin131]|uniref:Isoleucine--tRNA ligase n=1 Tax=candidate division TA06 bacterium ADurb.Bin131 TaxID=1852827 RepID=A0A1V6C8H9_UNCT6|nr:MAG: Isoleucine--tRNA ligase [candidate division TA06 bacterium ADurb.Bin131]
MSEINYSKTVLLPKTDFPMKADLARREPDFLKKWQDMDIYNKILEKNKGKQTFILHDGPPYANGHIHLGTALNKILKDTVVKFKSFQGFYSPYVPGWDCHGMPIEHQVFQQLKLKDKNTVDIVSFRKKAHDYAMKFMAIQRAEFQRLGVFGDWENPYLTLNPGYEKAIIENFGKLFVNGYIIQRFKPIYWCWHCQTALAEAEVEYSDETSPSVYVKFPVKKFSVNQDIKGPLYFLIWTTTPWTLPANVAIAVHPQLDYSIIKTQNGNFVVASTLVEKICEKLKFSYEIIARFKGKDLEHTVCAHPFVERESPVVLADYVSDVDGTGCVHTATGHGEEDYQTGLRYNLPVISPVDEKGRFTDDVPEWKGMLVFEADPLIVENLISRNIVLYTEQYQHSYPHCWRCKKPVIFRSTKQWFLKIDHKNLRHTLQREIKKTRWIPEEGMSRISSMVELRPDWCLSRQRLWGVALPIFYCDGCGFPICNEQTISKVADLVGRYGSNIWFEKDIMELMPENFVCPDCGSKGPFHKEKDILDVWFDSGVSHLAVLKNHPQLRWPADFYLEGSDQHRGWFQTSLITSCAVENRAPFEIVLTHGFVVDAEGRKMSKSLGNVITPEQIIKKYGADILRLWALSENYQQDMRISQKIIDHLVIVYRTLRNTMRFILGNLNDYDSSVQVDESDFLEVDKWAIARLNQVAYQVKKYYEDCLFHKGVGEIFDFCNIDMSSFYLDYLKDRLYTYGKDSTQRRAAQKVLHQILSYLVVMLAPVLSFTCEEAYTYLPMRKNESVFLENWPEIQDLDDGLLKRWEKFFEFRKIVLKQIEEKRASGEVGSSLEVEIEIKTDLEYKKFLESFQPYLTNLLMVAECKISENSTDLEVTARKTNLAKCARCWIHHPTVGKSDEHPYLCEKCFSVVNSI